MKLYGIVAGENGKDKWVPVEFRKNGTPIEPAEKIKLYKVQGRDGQFNGSRTYSLKGLTFKEAVLRFRTLQAEIETGVTACLPDERGAVSLFAAAEQYLSDLDRRASTKSSYRHALREFGALNPHLSLSIPPENAAVWHQTETADKWRPVVVAYQRWLQTQNMSTTTRHARLLRVVMLLRHFDVSGVLLKKTEWPKINSGNPDPYTDEELDKLRAAANPYERRFLELALRSGARKGELKHATKSCVRVETREGQKIGLFEIKANPTFGFELKDNEERIVPISAALAEEILDSLKDKPDAALLFPSRNGKPNKNLLESIVKKVAKRAGVRAYVHRFRDTYLSKLARGGLDIFSLQKNAGHSDINTTRRYVEAAAATSAYQVGKAQQVFGD